MTRREIMPAVQAGDVRIEFALSRARDVPKSPSLQPRSAVLTASEASLYDGDCAERDAVSLRGKSCVAVIRSF